jgi:hypothetical protein
MGLRIPAGQNTVENSTVAMESDKRRKSGS